MAGSARGQKHALSSIGIAMAALFTVLAHSSPSHATPQFARKYDVNCNACHSVTPALNLEGLAFAARGYRMSGERESEKAGTLPLAVWLTGRHENQEDADFEDTYFSRVELISGGPIGDSLSYFVEWRVLSKETRSDGSLRDRSGRFEDAMITARLGERSSLTLGQYRAINQVDVSRRLSITEPALLSTSIPGKVSSDARITSLRGFAPAGRSPSVTFSYQSMQDEYPSDGLFHFVTVPFPGELSIPLSSKARDEASFELRGEPKGVFLETFHRNGLSSLGLHSFIGDDRWLATTLGTLEYKSFLLTGGVGVDDRRDGTPRVRSSLEAEYYFVRDYEDKLRAMLGFRVEHISNSGTDPAFIAYTAISMPKKFYNSLLQLQYRSQKENDGFFVELSLQF